LIKTHEIAINAKNMNPTALKVQLKPIILNRRDSMMGSTMPPAEDPELTMPKTVPRFVLNHDVVDVREAVKTAPEPMELSSAWDRRI
jgi:hypothetical protein